MLLKPGFQKEYLPAFIRVARLLTCFDFRKDMKTIARIYGSTERALRMHLKKLQDENVKASHLRVPSAANLHPVIVRSKHVYDRDMLLDIKRSLGYLANYKLAVTTEGSFKSLMIFLVPGGSVGRQLLEKIPELGEATACKFIPINSCAFIQGRVEENVDAATWESSGYDEARRISGIILEKLQRSMFLVFTAALDANPLAQRAQVTDSNILPKLIPKRASWVDSLVRRVKWQLKKLYDDLSLQRLLGRVLVWGVEEAAPLLVEVDASDAPLLHMLASYYAVSDGVLVCDDGRAYAVVPALQRVMEFIRRLVEEARARLTFLVGGLRFGLPLELWDYKKGVWLYP